MKTGQSFFGPICRVSNFGSLALMNDGGFPYSSGSYTVQVQAISCTPLSPGWAPAVNLVLWLDNRKGCQIHQKMDNSLDTLNQPSPRLEPTTNYTVD